ncbi:DUF4135 domain-containing protein [Luteipulveratus sp. YIM 133132]|uniref:DUF4135 domain-containing protein n=1 Tax=Luteipulveratus flavus TaxID=3031728 RepID=UPI0023B08B21|nr:DUF4135 domain-containing protein [Luteipulveratus sp. YIM 133132]MDE9364931.1 DUF4135 domain-containing protein [Luteipulveratus sp. YIM 133132]
MDKVTAAVLDCFAEQIEIGSASTTTVESSILAEAARSCIADRLARILPRVFVVEFHRFRVAKGLPADRDSTVAISEYLDDLGPDVVQQWLSDYPVLRRLAGGVIDLSTGHLREVASRFDADRTLLEREGWLREGSRPVRLQTLSADPHQGGRVVTAVLLDDGTRIIYKPRSLGTEQFTRYCFEQVSAASGVEITDCAPESLDRTHYGWQQEVVSTPARTETDVEDYYRRLGAMSAVLGALGATDMHHENVLAVGDHPVAVDLETVMHAERNLASQQISIGLISRIKLSLADTLLLPQRMPTGPYSVLMAGVGVARAQESQRTEFVLVDVDTDAVDIAKRTYNVGHTTNVLMREDGSVTDILDYEREFLDGFVRARAGLVTARDAIAQRLESRPVRLRHIFRSTATYGRLMDAATHPDNLRRQEDYERVIGMLSAPPGCERRAVQQFVAGVERAAMATADVPFFSIDSDDLRARAGQSVSSPCADLTPAERALAGIAMVDETSLPLELLMIDEGLAELRALRQLHDPSYSPDAGGPFHHCLGAAGIDVEAGIAVMDELAVTSHELRGVAAGWLIGNFGPDVGTFDPGTAVSMHDAGGIHVLYERAAAGGLVTAERRQEVANGLRSLYRQYREKVAGVPASVASGPLSLDYVFEHGADRLTTPRRWCELLELSEESRAGADLMKGVGGAGLLLSSYADASEDTLARLLHATAAGGAPKGRWDLAHGDLGLVWARHRMMRRLGLDEEATALREQLQESLETVPTGLTRAWCAGYGGLLLVSGELRLREDLLQSLAARACELPEVGAPIDLSVCHGAAGVVQALVHVAQSTGQRWPVEAAQDFWARAGKHALDEGYFTGDPARRSMLGYFLGWSGILDSGLLLRHATDGARVWVPVAFSAGSVRS